MYSHSITENREPARKKSKLYRLRHTLSLNAPQNYANRFAIVFNSHESRLMHHLLMSLGNIDTIKIVTRVFTSQPHFSKGHSSSSVSNSWHSNSSPTAFYHGKYPVLEFPNVQSYLKYFDELCAVGPDGIFNLMSVRSFQTNEAIIIMVGFSYTTTLVDPQDANTSSVIDQAVSSSANSINRGASAASASAQSVPNANRDNHDALAADFPLGVTAVYTSDDDSSSPRRAIALPTVTVRGSLALYLDITTGKLYRFEFFSQLMPDKPSNNNPRRP